MTEKVQDALPVVEQEPKGPPTPDVSGGSADAGSAAPGPDASALEKKLTALEERLEKLPDLIDARVKSTKDKRFQDLEKVKQYLDEAKGDAKLAARNMYLDQVLQEGKEPAQVQPSALGRATGGDAESKTAKFLNDLKDESGVELSDEELEQVWRGKRYTNWDDAFKDVRRAAFKKAKGESIGAGAAVKEASTPPQGETEESLTAELADILSGKRGSAVSIENKKRRQEIKDKLAAKRR